MANYCSNCGSKLEEGSDFCTNCGTPIKHENKQKSNPSNSVLDNNSNLNNKLGGMDMGNMIKCIVPIVIIVILLVIGMSLFGGGDSVDVKDVYLSNHLPHRGTITTTATPLVDTPSQDIANGVFKFSIVPKTDLTHIIGIRLENVEIIYDGYDSDNYDSVSLNYENNENDNILLSQFNTLSKDYLYTFYFKFKVEKEGLNHSQNSEALQSIKHIKADIVIDTTTESNVVIGHIDNDVSFES